MSVPVRTLQPLLRQGGICALALALALASAVALQAAEPAPAAEPATTSTYDRIAVALDGPPNRLPGSPGYQTALAAVASGLEAAGVRTGRMTYSTMVPETRTCRLTVDGVPVEGLLAMAPNGVVPPTTWGRELEGPAVWLGNGSLAEMDGLPVAGSIAFVRLGSDRLPDIFAQGALAIVAVGDEAAQWQAAKMFTEAPVASPRAWLPWERAVQAGLTANPPSVRRAKLAIEVVWKDVVATNLWAHIPASRQAGAEQSVQTIVLAAELATSGAVPELSPGGRQAANVALLAELTARLSRAPLDRDVLAVFLGSHYAAQDGARSLYWVIGTPAARRKQALEARRDGIATALAQCASRSALLATDEVLNATGDDAAWSRNHLRRVLAARVNSLNYRLRSHHLARVAARDRPEAAEVAVRQIADLDAKIAIQNNLRRQLHERVVTDRPAFADLRNQLLAELTALAASLHADAAHVESCLELNAAMADQQVIAHLGIDFADAALPWMTNPFGLTCETTRAMSPGSFVRHIEAYQQAWRVAFPVPLSGVGALISPDRSATYGFDNLCTPARRQVACVVPIGLGLMGSQLVTLGDPLARDEMPTGQTPDLRALAPPLAGWLAALAAGDLPSRTGLAISNNYDGKLVYGIEDGAWAGLRVDRLAKGSEEVDGPADQAVVFVRRGFGPGPYATAPCGRSSSPMARVNPAGYLVMPGVFDSNTRAYVNAMAFDEAGAPEAYFNGSSSTSAMTYNIRLFSGFGNALYTPFTPADYSISRELVALTGRTDARPKRSFSGVSGGGALVVTSEEHAIKLHGNGLFVLGDQSVKPQGTGFAVDPSALLSLDALRHSSEEATTLNRNRLEILRRKDLVNRPAERLHADATDHLDSAREARAANEVRSAAAHEVFAATLSYRAHGPLRAGANDLLRAVIILLILSIPFAFAAERLALGAATIYRQLIGFLGIFVATFLILYVTHPAFAMADSPLIIFLAFIIILLSAFVISVVMGKFKHELKAMQGLSARSHSTGNANSTTMAAIIIGIAGMRNRPLKTGLTIVTVTLLTFTILVFASFQSGKAVVETWLSRSRGADRIEVHQTTFLRIPNRLVDAIETIHEGRFDVLRRTASFRDPLGSEQEKDQVNVVLDPATGKALRLNSVLGFDPRELALMPALAEVMQQQGPATVGAPIWLSETVAGQLKLKPGSAVIIRGKAFVLAGVFAEERLRGIENIDGTKLLPPDFEATLAASGNQSPVSTAFSEAFQSIDPSAFVFSTPALTALTLNREVAPLGGGTTTVMLYPKDGAADIARAASDIAQVFNGPVYATTGAGASKFFFTDEVTGAGYMDLLVPLLLGGLIIFSSLLGSIVDRQKEIFTYSALGLSPRDIGTLFFAESAVIAVIGGMGGYLVGQLAAKLLNLVANSGLMAVPDLNFSSLSSLVTILIVMAMVMLSTIYPALTASRSANPGINRAWRMPKPDGDRLTFTFPFTVPETSFGGIIAFVREHFHNHGDAALDIFAAKDVELFRVDARRVGIRAGVALAPFDLGVFQKFAMRTRPSDIPGIDEVVVEIERENGSQGTWLRGNRAFVADLREQFLIWRSLSPEAIAHYQAESVHIMALAESGPTGPDVQRERGDDGTT